MHIPYREDYKPETTLPKGTGSPVIYISGPMSGYEGYNYPAFLDASQRLIKAGWRVICPAQPAMLRVQDDYDYCLKHSLALLLRANAVALLPGWEESKGVAKELEVAKWFGYDVKTLDEWLDGNGTA